MFIHLGLRSERNRYQTHMSTSWTRRTTQLLGHLTSPQPASPQHQENTRQIPWSTTPSTAMTGHQETLLITIPFEPFEESYARLKELQSQAGVELEILHYNTKDTDTVPPGVWHRTTIHLTLYLFPKTRDQVPHLKWTHLYSGGINQALSAPLLHDPSIIWTRNGGVHAPQIAEWTIGTLLAYHRQLPAQLKWQGAQTWRASDYRARGDLVGQTIAFMGYGAIARHTARIAAACGMRVVAFTLHARCTPESRHSTTFTPRHTGDPRGEIPEAWHAGDVDAFLDGYASGRRKIDVLVVALPSTEKTRGLLGRAQFEKLAGCYLINIARGDIVQTDALLAALDDGTLRGAALDVTDPEPLPDGHPLWSARNVIITPHTSGVSDEYMPRTVEILDGNLRRLHAGEELFNLVHRSDGY